MSKSPRPAQEEQRVGGQRSSHVPALGPARFDRRRDLDCFLAAAEQAVLAGMRIDAADADLRLGDAGTHQHLMSARDHALDQARLDLLDRIDEADMRGDMNDAQLRRYQHHRHFRRARQMRQQLGVARDTYVRPRAALPC